MRPRPLLPFPLAIVACGLAILAACAPADPEPSVGGAEARLDDVAERYVRLVLGIGLHDAAYVDAYYGPPEWRDEVESAAPTLDALTREASTLESMLPDSTTENDPGAGRDNYLRAQIAAAAARLRMLAGETFTFDEEAEALYAVVPPSLDDAHFEAIRAELDPLLPGEGSLRERLDRFRAAFTIPEERLDAVFRRAIDACRERTVEHLELPEGESFTVEYVTDKSWSGYNWYRGEYRSLIQVNTDLPITIDRAIDLACHEGYPGHHTYNALLEHHLVRERGWVEFSVYPLFSPQSLIAEGTANLGIDIAFPGEERVAFERESLFHVAGIDPEKAATYYRVLEILERASYAGNEVARAYLDGAIDADEAAARLERYALMSPARARQRVSFIDDYRSYVINYNLGKDLVRQWVERRGGTADDPARRWEVFGELLSSPRLPPDLVLDP